MGEVEPAMTPEQWAEEFSGEWRRVREGQVFLDPKYGLSAAHDAGCASVTIDNPRSAAALALHDEPFGFTWDDVDEVRRCATISKLEEGSCEALGGDADAVRDRTERLRSLADRIAALLPPRDG